MKKTILCIEHNTNLQRIVQHSAHFKHFHILHATNGQKALQQITSTTIDLIICTLSIPFVTKKDFPLFLLKNYTNIPVIIIADTNTFKKALELVQQGAYAFIIEPLDAQKLISLIKNALSGKPFTIDPHAFHNNHLTGIIGNAPSLTKVFEIVQRVASSNANILIYGENGTGKELVANAIHRLSHRNIYPLIKVHCAALNDNLLESELFGHEKGAFTGASFQKRGRFEIANRGTLFLDEIGEISPMLQVKLLRVLQEKEFERVGGEQTLRVDIRVIAATNKNLQQSIQKGLFREDLYFRLNVIEIHLPPLRERLSDIPLLADAFIEEFSRANNKSLVGITKEALACLARYHWPGNIRQLRNILESCVVMSTNSIITKQDLPEYIFDSKTEDHIRISIGSSLRDVEKQVILATLLKTHDNKTHAAKILQIERKTLYRKLNEYKRDRLSDKK